MLGLRGWTADDDGNWASWSSTGLIQSAESWLGTERVTDAGSEADPAGAYATLETANYDYDSAGGDTKMKLALDNYLAW